MEFREIHSLYLVSFQELSSLAGGNDPLSPPSPYLAFSDNYFFPWRDLCLCQLEVETFREGDISVGEMDISWVADNSYNSFWNVPMVAIDPAENDLCLEGQNLHDNRHPRSYCHPLVISEQHLKKGWSSQLYSANYQHISAQVFDHFCECLKAAYAVLVFSYPRP